MIYSKIEGEGKPLLIIHGFLGMSDNWKTMGTQFAADGFQVHLLDLRNHGKSFHSDEFNYEIMAQDVFDYCQAHHLEKVSIIGHSMGGKTAMLFAANHSEMVEKLIVADIGPKFYPRHHQVIFDALNAVDFSKKPSRNEVEEIVSKYITDFGTRQFLLKVSIGKSRDNWHSDLTWPFSMKIWTKLESRFQKILFSTSRHFLCAAVIRIIFWTMIFQTSNSIFQIPE